MAVFMLRTCNESVNSCKGGIFCVFLTPYQRYLCRHCEVSHSETTIPPHWVSDSEPRYLPGCTHGMDWQPRNESCGCSTGRVPGRKSMIYDRCGLSCPWLPFLFSPPLPGENRHTPRWSRHVCPCGMTGIERSEDDALLTRAKRRCAVRILSCSLRVPPPL